SLAMPLALAFAGLGATGCEPAAPVKAGTASGLPRWEAHEREVFDDNIDPAAVGLSMDGPSPRNDAHLRERAQTADVVARVRVNPVPIDSVGEQKPYPLGIQVGVPTLSTARVRDRTFELLTRPSSGVFGIAKAFEARLRGQT